MDACSHQSESCSFAVCVRHCVDLGAGVEKYLRNFNGVLRGLLPVILEAVRAHIVKKRGPMYARRTRSNQFRIFT